MSFALSAISFSQLVSETLRIKAYIVFTYFFIVTIIAIGGKIINPKYHPRIAMILYEVFICGIGGFTGLVAAYFKIPLLIDILVVSIILAFSTILNSLLLIKEAVNLRLKD